MTNDEVVQKVREIARPMGWAIGIHGSMKRDIDLIAVPWVEDAKGAWDLYEAIRDAFKSSHSEPARGNLRLPNGRMALMVIQGGAVSYKGKNDMDDWNPPAIDISFVDLRQAIRSIRQAENVDPEQVNELMKTLAPSLSSFERNFCAYKLTERLNKGDLRHNRLKDQP